MAPPTSPYVTPALATILLQNMFRGQVPNNNTAITGSVYDQIILWSDSLLQGWFAGVGYKIPFVAITGETWPTYQTTMLQMMSAVASGAFASGHIPLPAPRMVPGRDSGSRNVYAMMLDSFRKQIELNGMGFRGQYYLGKPAEQWCNEPYGPRTDFYDGYYDKTRYQRFAEFTDTYMEVFADMKNLNINWDYLSALTESTSD